MALYFEVLSGCCSIALFTEHKEESTNKLIALTTVTIALKLHCRPNISTKTDGQKVGLEALAAYELRIESRDHTEHSEKIFLHGRCQSI